MKSHDVLDLATRNLRESVLRNSLTTLGIAVGIASLVAMLSLGIGLQNTFSKQFTRAGLFDTIMVTPKREFSGLGRGPMQPTGADSRVLDDKARADISRLPNVLEVAPSIRFTTEIRYQDKPGVSTVSGLQPSAAQNDAFENMQGHFFSGPKADEAILQADFAKELNPQPAKLIGQDIVLRYAERQDLNLATADPETAGFSVLRREHKLRVVGIIDREPYSGIFGLGHGGVFIPVQLAEDLNVMQAGDLRGLTTTADSEGRTYQSLMVRVFSPKEVEQVEEIAKKMGFSAMSMLDYMRNLKRVFAVVDMFLGIFGSLALAVASLGIINTLVMAILERRREIGIMKAIGASDGDIKRLFFAEAGAMGAVGGALGVLLGWLIGRTINFGTTMYLRHQQLPTQDIWLVPWWLVLGAIGFALLVTLVSGLYPAARAARLDPVQALRYE
jgi:putative ABC transport system permease protein